MQGLITKSTGSWYQVQTPNGERYDCRIKGKFRIKGITTTNPLAVGDVVDFEMEPEQGTGVITNLHQRKNYIIRKSINLSKQAQIIAANMDQAFLVVTLASPRTSLGFIDRFLATAEAYGIPARYLRISDHEPLYKYHDYYQGTNRSSFTYASTVQEALEMGGESPAVCDLEKLYTSFPFECWPHATFKHPNFNP